MKFKSFFLSVLLVLLFTISLNISSSCYAAQPNYNDFEIPVEFFDALLNYYNNVFPNYCIQQYKSFNFTSEDFKNTYDVNIKPQLINDSITYGFNEQNLIFFLTCDIGTPRIFIFINNNTIGNIENSTSFYVSSFGSSQIYFSNSPSFYNVYCFSIEYGNLSAGKYNNPSGFRSFWKFENSQVDIERSTLINSPFFGLNAVPLNVVNCIVPNSDLAYWFIDSYYNINEVPEIPDIPEEPEESGDVPGTGGSGTITNPSGDTTGNIDLSGIEQGIGNINQNLENIKDKIPTSEDIKESTIAGVIAGNTSYWGSSGDIDAEDYENELADNFNGIMENLSGELSQNQIFESLQSGENGFLNFFKEQQNERFYDLAFSWPDIEYMGGVIIPKGGINISEMCREIPELGQLQSLIRVIFNFSVAIALIKQIYNLILSTLGIDNPYLYEDYDDVSIINADTGEVRENLYRRRRVYRK